MSQTMPAPNLLRRRPVSRGRSRVWRGLAIVVGVIGAMAVAGAAFGIVLRGAGHSVFALGDLGKSALGLWLGGGRGGGGGEPRGGGIGGGGTPDDPFADFRTTASGLRIKDDVVGTGAVAPTVCRATVGYVGAQHAFPPDPAAAIFDASSRHGRPVAFSIGARRVIRGWDEGIPGMAVGGTRRLIIPSDLAYGPDGNGDIEGGATLYFTVELVNVTTA
ncbi:hypothetical protein BU14_0518s0014 [Porphyra umbilicalis]|uniref:peptidylprolyl isomerase n=1 Tax=Porphyra umbilicalis TaxID=2786 RepID=A0A1X6NSP3_PORUM|nr:hypothetical protein BU14_0518s0014 [Porphyra umbilicalis]|eukprot:OSX71622.1 hypothetical protein BU14_0518s0014 [Porphyra umbilicalis]